MILYKDIDVLGIVHTGDFHLKDNELQYFEQNFDNLLNGVNSFVDKRKICRANIMFCVIGDLFDNRAKNHNFETLLIGAKSLHKIVSAGYNLLVTIGNHDYDKKNKTKIDYITPLYEIYNNFGDNPKFDYMKSSGYYVTNNVIFKHLSIWDDMDIQKINPPSFDNKKIIGLFHGCLDSSLNYMGIDITQFSDEPHPTTDIFKGCDAGLMADIHYPQEIENNLGIPVVYCGSAWQVDGGETIENHSVPFWFIDDDIYYKRIPTKGVIERYKYLYDGQNFTLKNK